MDFFISAWMHHTRILSLGFAAAIVAASGSPTAGAQSTTPNTQIEFNIPAQPLARALVAYGAATGLEIFYNAALADNQHSTTVAGVLTPSAALHILLRGTGYVAQSTGLGAFTITLASREAVAEARKRLQPYFAALQIRISDVLCRNAETAADKELLFQFWLSSSGVITRAEVIDDDGQLAPDQSAAAAIRGLALVAPPAGMQQPISMVFFPPSKALRACGPANARREG